MRKSRIVLPLSKCYHPNLQKPSRTMQTTFSPLTLPVIFQSVERTDAVFLNKQLPSTLVRASLPVQLSNTSVQLVWRESVKQLSRTLLNSFKQGKSWQRPCVEIQHMRKLWIGHLFPWQPKRHSWKKGSCLCRRVSPSAALATGQAFSVLKKTSESYLECWQARLRKGQQQLSNSIAVIAILFCALCQWTMRLRCNPVFTKKQTLGPSFT